MAVAKVILNGNTLIDTTDKTVASSNLLYPNTALGANGEAVTGEVKIEDITISQDYLVEQNTVISNGIIFQTDETYPGTPVVIDNAKYANINNGDLGQNGTGIKIDLNKTYHCTGELKIEWSTGEQEIYSIDSDFTLINYGFSAGLSFSWEGIETSTQTFSSINLNFQSSAANGYKIFMRPGTADIMTKSGVLLDGSYYQISVTSDGFNTINLNLSDDPRFQAIYKSLAYRSIIASSAPRVSEWCNSLSRIASQQFAGQQLSGSFTFNNVTNVFQGAFGVIWSGNGFSMQGSAWFNFPNSALSILHQDIFLNNGMIRGISANNVNLISTNAFYSCRNLSEVNFPNCTYISTNAFYYCPSLSNISFPNCITICSSAFQSCSALTTANFPSCITIGNSAFQSCTSLSNISFPQCTTISNSAFYNCSKLTTVSFPECTSIGAWAFSNCKSLITVSFPKCTSIGNTAFQNCSNLTTVSFPECTIIEANAFQSCINLTTAYFPKCISMFGSVFYYCSSLTSIYAPELVSIGTNTFRNTGITTASFPKCTTIQGAAFNTCQKLSEIYFMGSSVITLSTMNFLQTPMSMSTLLGYYGSIYVPASLLASYKTATNWAAYSARIVGI